MKMQVAFIHNNEKFFTIQDCEYIKSVFANTNVIRQPDLLAKASYQSDFARHNNNKNFKYTPMVNVSNVEQTGQFYNVTGTVEIDGVMYDVSLTRESLTLTKIGCDEVSTESEESVAEETTNVLEEVKEEEQEEKQIKVQGFTSSKPKTQSVLENIQLGYSINGYCAITKQPKPSHRIIGDTRGAKNHLAFKEKDMPTLGIVFGKREPSKHNTKEIPLGIEDTNTAGISFGQRVVQRGTASKRNLRNEALRQQAVISQQNKEREEENDRLQKSWSQHMSPKQRFDSLQPVPTEFNPSLEVHKQQPAYSEERVVEESVNNKSARDEAKAAIRKELSDELNKVIGDIPVDLLGSIAEFTMEPINSVEVLNGKDMYCIDRRWHKQGKWFCIDVVPNTSRYFYNSRLGVNIEIPINILKAWKEAIDS